MTFLYFNMAEPCRRMNHQRFQRSRAELAKTFRIFHGIFQQPCNLLNIDVFVSTVIPYTVTGGSEKNREKRRKKSIDASDDGMLYASHSKIQFRSIVSIYEKK